MAESIRMSLAHSRSQIISTIAIGLTTLLFGIAVLSLANREDAVLLGGMLLGLGLGASLSGALARSGMRQTAEKAAKDPFNATFFQSRSFRFGDEAFEAFTEGGARDYVPWSTVVSWREVGPDIIVNISRFNFYWFSAAHMTPECLAFVKAHLHGLPTS